MRLSEVFEHLPGLRRALLTVQQHVLDEHSDWDTEIAIEGNEPILRVTAERTHKLEPFESKERNVILALRAGHDGRVTGWLNGTYCAYYGDDEWNSPAALETLATNDIPRRMRKQLERNRTVEMRLSLLRDLEEVHHRWSVSCPVYQGRHGIAFMSLVGSNKLYVYVAIAEDTPNYENYGYLVGEGDSNGHRSLKLYETVIDVGKAVKKWLKANT